MSLGIQPQTRRTCDAYLHALKSGEDPIDVVGYLANSEGVQRPAIYRRLIAGGIKPKYAGPKADKPAPRHRKWRSLTECESQRAELPRVDRDPCQRCGVRHDIGCHHNRMPLGMVL